MIKEHKKTPTPREHERAEVRRVMRRWVKLREHFDGCKVGRKRSV